ncbi:DUF3006 domain-containing protein [Halobacteria archaeon HArc-gm2]|nr:DUF3006 domain-containing protein [Halobacteria archaeon HArc-gm2]
MPSDGTYTAVVDRFEEDLAVLLLEADGDTVGEVVVDEAALPADGRHVDAVLAVELEDDELVEVTYTEAETDERSDQAQSRFDSLSQRPPSGDDKDDAG